MKKGFDWWDWNVTNEIYINTNRSDWWSSCEKIAGLLKHSKSVIDVGGGDGHTLWQILSTAIKHGAPISAVSFVEPSTTALKHARARLKQLPISTLNFYKGTLESVESALVKKGKEHFDVLYAGHVNYYFGKQANGKHDVDAYRKALALLPQIAHTVILMTAPKNSDYYKVVSKNPFGKEVFSENVADFYRSKGYSVKSISTPMRSYVAHAQQSPHEAAFLWKFFHDTEEQPTKSILNSFIKRLRAVMDKEGNIDFKDKLIVITQK